MNQLKLFISILILLVVSNIQAQAPEKLNVADSLSFMAGHWKGTGWISAGPGERHLFEQTEDIVPHVKGSVLLITGKGYALEDLSDSILIHDALAVVIYKEEEKAFYMQSFSTSSEPMLSKLQFEKGRIFSWQFETERGTVRFTEDFSAEGQWTSSGHFSADGQNWYPFFEMKLRRVI